MTFFRSIKPAAIMIIGGTLVLDLFLRVTPADGEPFDAKLAGFVKLDAKELFRPGMTVRVRYVPEKRTSLIRLDSQPGVMERT